MFNPITAEALARAIHQDLLRDAEIARRAHRPGGPRCDMRLRPGRCRNQPRSAIPRSLSATMPRRALPDPRGVAPYPLY
jgi:hypothetical protein